MSWAIPRAKASGFGTLRIEMGRDLCILLLRQELTQRRATSWVALHRMPCTLASSGPSLQNLCQEAMGKCPWARPGWDDVAIPAAEECEFLSGLCLPSNHMSSCRVHVILMSLCECPKTIANVLVGLSFSLFGMSLCVCARMGACQTQLLSGPISHDIAIISL